VSLRATLAAIALFVVLCGVLLLALGSPSEPSSPPEASPQDHIEAAKEVSYEIERSLHEGNYGAAKKDVVELREELDAARAALEP
jgi:ABC-type transporter Mla subunit MlaD